QKVDPCSKSKCVNNATCKVSENSYVCECEPNYYGEYCQSATDARYVLVFTRAGVTDSVRLEGFKSNLSMISICLWIQTMDTHNYGTILSYATFKFDNTFTITDYGGLVFYINNKKIYSDIQLNDGFWHNFCFTWDSEDGNYRIYVDGKVIQQGENFAKGELLEGNGKLIIGQEQDIMGGRFSQSEAFLGKVTHFDVWNRVLSAKDVVDQLNDCNKERFGNVYAYRIYVDGKVIQQGENFAKGELLEGNGKLIIGQEQDIMGGRFSQSEAFLGKVTHFDVWNRVLSAKDVVDQMNDCNKERFGNVHAWPEMKEYVFGKVEIENSAFCVECKRSLAGPIANGYIEILNNTAYYRCDKGYILSDNKYRNGRHCNKAGEWEGQQEPYCKVLYCLYPGYIRHGRIHGRKYSYLSQIHYTCNTGYKMKGNDTRICGDKGVWEPDPPACLGLRCKAFEVPENGKIMIFSDYSDEYQEDLESYDVGTSIEITCNMDAKLVGEPIVTCEVTGEWDNEIPECIKKKPKFPCSLDHIPLPPPNGYITEESQAAVNNFSSYVIEFKCQDGYRLVGDSITTCILDGYWTQPNITCELVPAAAKCPAPPKVKNAKLIQINTVEYFAGDKVNYECVEGYRLLGNAFVKCSASGKWSRFGGKCIKKTCGKPNVAESTVVQGKSYLFGEKIKIICRNGNEYTLTCESSGKWSSITDNSC
ncbi:EGF domain-containing protein, partial [Oryctes borbonicus]